MCCETSASKSGRAAGIALALGLLLLPLRAPAQDMAAGGPPAVTRDYQKACCLLKVTGGKLYEVDTRHFAVLADRTVLLVTSEYAAVPGFQGPPSLAILLGTDGTVKQTVLLRSGDTKPYLTQAEKRLGDLAGQKVSATERPVLAVTGATRSSRGLGGTVNGALDAFAPVFARLKLSDTEVRCDDKPLAPIADLATSQPPAK